MAYILVSTRTCCGCRTLSHGRAGRSYLPGHQPKPQVSVGSATHAVLSVRAVLSDGYFDCPAGCLLFKPTAACEGGLRYKC